MKLVRGRTAAAAVNGLDMLLYQGVIAYELWNPQVNGGQRRHGDGNADRQEDCLTKDQAGARAGERT